MTIGQIFDRLRAFEPRLIPSDVTDTNEWASELSEELAPVLTLLGELIADVEHLNADAENLADTAAAVLDAQADAEDAGAQLDSCRAAEKDPDIGPADRRDLIDEVAAAEENLVEAQQNLIQAHRDLARCRADVTIAIRESVDAWGNLDRVPSPRIPSVRS